MKKLLLLLILISTLTQVYSQTAFKLTQVANGYTAPLDIQNAGDSRLFVVTRPGVIYILDSAFNKLPNPFLDINTKVHNGADERGLLGLAFHPNYAQNGYFFVNYVNNAGNTIIARYNVTADPNIADPDSEVILKEIIQPYSNHKGGCLQFGKDGYLYIGMGDGGSGNDPQNRAQNPKEFLGKMLRIDVDNGSPYSIPPSNPFINNPDTLPEIWALGYRNPWRFSFDRLTDDMYIGDVGQDAWEEIDFELADSPGGLNYGWRCYEGFAPKNLSGCGPEAGYTPPVHVLKQDAEGYSVTGGYVYRGSKYPGLYGKYIYTDFGTSIFRALYRNNTGNWVSKDLAKITGNSYSGFGQDINGELYVAGLSSGRILRLDMDCKEIPLIQMTIDACKDSLNGEIIISSNTTLEYQWSTGDTTSTLTGLGPGLYQLTVIDSLLCATTLDSIRIGEVNSIAHVSQINDSTLLVQFANQPESIQWLLNGVPIPGAHDTIYVPQESGFYSVDFSYNGCELKSVDSVSVIVTSVDHTDYIGLSIWPNPAKNILNIKSHNSFSNINHINIYNTLGQLVLNAQLIGQLASIDVSSLPTGIYAIEANQDGKRKLIKFMKN